MYFYDSVPLRIAKVTIKSQSAMIRQLVFFTSAYPNAQGEVFVENEIRYLEKAFDKILIICSAPKDAACSRYLPANAEVITLRDHITWWHKWLSMRFLFHRSIREEVTVVKNQYHTKMSLAHWKVLLIEYCRARQLFRQVQRIVQKLNQSAPPILYSYWSDYKAICCALLKQAYPNQKAVARNHGWDVYFYVHQPAYLPLRKFLFDNLDKVFCISDHGRHYITETLNFSHDNIFLSKLGTHNNIATLTYKPTLGMFTIVSCSNLIPLKRVHLIINALSQINDLKIHWVHFGTGPLMEDLVDLAMTKLTQENLSYEFRGAVPNEDVLNFYSNHQVDMFINVSESEGIPVSIMEAMSFGIPVVATEVGGNTEIVQEATNGYLLPKETTPQLITEKIRMVFSLQDQEKIQLKNGALQTWKTNYNSAKNYPEFIRQLGA